ncbi:Putative Genomic scaffold, msy_sf_4 [Rhizopus microsporus]|nr:Putative Genomic scaffold, msy_sf_4 [Rhizopus microsporus]
MMLGRGTTNDGDPDCTEELEDNSKSILMGIISQLRKDMDLQRVTLPTFVLEPRSMLERVTDFMSHPDLLLEASTKTDPTVRFLDVVRYFLSGWHIKPKGVKKPYNPVLGEFFRCKYKYSNGTEAIYVAEQVSHHPPISAFYYGSPENGIYIQGDLRPKSRFLGNSAATLMEGENHIIFTHLHNERYDITMPNIYARGILCKFDIGFINT